MSVVNTTLGSSGQVGSTAAALVNELRPTMLANAEFDDFLEQYICEQEPVGANAKTVMWNRMERLAVATTPSQLTEGVEAAGVGLTINDVTATVEEYGNAVIISRLAQATARNNIVQNTIRILGYNVKETRDRLIYGILNAGTNVFRVADRATDNAIEVGDTLTFEELSQIRTTLRAAGAPKWPDGTYHLVSPTNAYGPLTVDPNYLATNQFQTPDQIKRGEVGLLLGIRVYETNSNSFTATASTTSGNSSAIRTSFAAGPGAAKVTDLMATEMHMQGPGQGSDWMKRRHQVGWTSVFKSVITNQDFLLRIRSSSDDATAVA